MKSASAPNAPAIQGQNAASASAGARAPSTNGQPARSIFIGCLFYFARLPRVPAAPKTPAASARRRERWLPNLRAGRGPQERPH